MKLLKYRQRRKLDIHTKYLAFIKSINLKMARGTMTNLTYFLTGVIWGLNILLAPTALDKEIHNQELMVIQYKIKNG